MTYGGFMALNGLVGEEEKALFAGELFREVRKRQLAKRMRVWGRRGGRKKD